MFQTDLTSGSVIGCHAMIFTANWNNYWSNLSSISVVGLDTMPYWSAPGTFAIVGLLSLSMYLAGLYRTFCQFFRWMGFIITSFSFACFWLNSSFHIVGLLFHWYGFPDVYLAYKLIADIYQRWVFLVFTEGNNWDLSQTSRNSFIWLTNKFLSFLIPILLQLRQNRYLCHYSRDSEFKFRRYYEGNVL